MQIELIGLSKIGI